MSRSERYAHTVGLDGRGRMRRERVTSRPGGVLAERQYCSSPIAFGAERHRSDDLQHAKGLLQGGRIGEDRHTISTAVYPFVKKDVRYLQPHPLVSSLPRPGLLRAIVAAQVGG